MVHTDGFEKSGPRADFDEWIVVDEQGDIEADGALAAYGVQMESAADFVTEK